MIIKMDFRSNCVVVCAFFLVLLPIFGMQPGEPQNSEAPTIRTTTSEVLLDFVVRDRSGKVIRDLKPGEVQVFEDGVAQPLRQFEFLNGRAEEPTSAPGTSALGTALGAPANAPAARTVNELRDMSVVSVVVGNLDPRGR